MTTMQTCAAPQKTANVTAVFHNAETGAFEANVTLQEDGRTHSFAVSVPAPITTEFDALRPALIAAAEQQMAMGTCDLTSRNAGARPVQADDVLTRILAAQPNYLDEILRRAA